MEVERKVLGHGCSDVFFGFRVVLISVRWQCRETKIGTEVVGQPVEMQLSRHLQSNNGRNPIEVLTALDLHSVSSSDGDVEVLTNASESAADAPCSAQNAAQRNGGGLGMVGRPDVGGGGDFNQREAQAVEVVDDLLAVSKVDRVQLSCAVFLKAHHVDAHRPLRSRQDAAGRNEGRSLKTAGVRSVNHRFPHGLNQGNGLCVEER